MEFSEYFRFLLALVFVLGLIGVLAVFARRAGLGYPKNLSRKSATKRIQVVETSPVDGRRRLVLIRRDDVEHLLILGQNSETVIETNINQPASQNTFNQTVGGTVTQLTNRQVEPE